MLNYNVSIKIDGKDNASSVVRQVAASIDALSQSMKNFSSSVTSSLNTNISSVANGFKNVTSATQNVTKSTTQATESLKRKGKAIDDLHPRLARFVGGLGSIAVKLNVFTAGISLAMTGVKQFGKFLGDSVKVSTDFETAITKVGVTAGTTAKEDLDLLKKSALDAGRATKFSASESAGALNELASAGFGVKGSIELLRPVLDYAAAGNIEIAKSSIILSSTLNAFSINPFEEYTKGISNATHLTDVFLRMTQVSSFKPDELANAMKNVGASATKLGYDFEKTASAMTLLKDTSSTAVKVGSDLQAVFNRFTMASKTKQASEAMASVGLSFYDASGKMKQLDVILDEVNTRIVNNTSLTQKQKDELMLTIFAQRGQQTILRMLNKEYTDQAGNIHKGADALRVLDAEYKNLQDTSKSAAERFNETFEGQIKLFQSAMESFMISTGDSLRDGLSKGLTSVRELLFGKEEEVVINGKVELKKTDEGLLDLVDFDSISKGFSEAMNTIANGIREMKPLFESVMNSIDFSKFFEYINSIVEQIPFETIAEQIDKIAPQISKAMEEVFRTIEYVMPVISPILDIVGSIASTVMELFNKLAEKTNDLLQRIMPSVTRIFEVVSSIMDALMPVVSTIFDTVLGIVDSLMPVVELVFNAIADIFKEIEPIITTVLSVIDEINKALQPIIKIVFDVIVATVKPAIEFIIGTIKTGISITRPFIDFLKAFLEPVLKPVIEAVGVAIEWIGSGIKQIEEALKPVFDQFKGIGDFIEKTIIANLEKVVGTVMKVGRVLAGISTLGISEAISGKQFDEMEKRAKAFAEKAKEPLEKQRRLRVLEREYDTEPIKNQTKRYNAWDKYFKDKGEEALKNQENRYNAWDKYFKDKKGTPPTSDGWSDTQSGDEQPDTSSVTEEYANKLDDINKRIAERRWEIEFDLNKDIEEMKEKIADKEMQMAEKLAELEAERLEKLKEIAEQIKEEQDEINNKLKVPGAFLKSDLKGMFPEYDVSQSLSKQIFHDFADLPTATTQAISVVEKVYAKQPELIKEFYSELHRIQEQERNKFFGKYLDDELMMLFETDEERMGVISNIYKGDQSKISAIKKEYSEDMAEAEGDYVKGIVDSVKAVDDSKLINLKEKEQELKEENLKLTKSYVELQNQLVKLQDELVRMSKPEYLEWLASSDKQLAKLGMEYDDIVKEMKEKGLDVGIKYENKNIPAIESEVNAFRNRVSKDLVIEYTAREKGAGSTGTGNTGNAGTGTNTGNTGTPSLDYVAPTIEISENEKWFKKNFGEDVYNQIKKYSVDWDKTKSVLTQSLYSGWIGKDRDKWIESVEKNIGLYVDSNGKINITKKPDVVVEFGGGKYSYWDIDNNTKTGATINKKKGLDLARNESSIGEISYSYYDNDKKQWSKIEGYRTGGIVNGISGIDRNLAWLTDGEFVVNSDSTEKYLPLLEMINDSPDLLDKLNMHTLEKEVVIKEERKDIHIELTINGNMKMSTSDIDKVIDAIEDKLIEYTV